jgi:hypothetical protein
MVCILTIFLLLEVLLQNIGRHDINKKQNDIGIYNFLFLSVDVAPVVVMLSSLVISQHQNYVETP